MAIRVLLIRLFTGNMHTDHYNDRAEHIRSRVNGVGNHGPGGGHQTGDQLYYRQHHVDDNADCGHPHGILLFLFLQILFTCRIHTYLQR